MKIQNNKRKTTTAIVTALVIGMIFLSPTTMLPSVNAVSQQKPFYLPNPVLTDNEKQQLIDIAMNHPGVKAWSNQWKFSTIDFKGEKTNTGMNWQEAIVFLRLTPSTPAPIQCDAGWIAEVRIDMVTHKVIDALYPTTQSHSCHGFSMAHTHKNGSDPPTFAIASDDDVVSTQYRGNSAVLTTPSYNTSIFNSMNDGISYLLNAEWLQNCTGPDTHCFLQGGWLMTTPSHSVGGLPANSADIVFVDESVTGTEDAYNTNIGYTGGGTLAVGINCLAGGSTVTISMQFGTSTFNDNSNVLCGVSETTNQYSNSVFFENHNTSPYTANGSTGWAQYVTGTVEATSATEYNSLGQGFNWSSSTNWQKDCLSIDPPVSSNSVINSGNLQNGGTAVWGGLTNVLTAC